MIDFFMLFGTNFYKNTPSTMSKIVELEAILGVSLPEDYKNFLLWSDGGEGEVGDLYLSMWSISQVNELNLLYSIRQRMGPRFIGIGTDGGDYCFALDFRNGMSFVVVPLGALADDEAKVLASTFIGGLSDICDGRITGNDLSQA